MPDAAKPVAQKSHRNENARKSLVQQQTEMEPADPAALAEMQVKNLDKFAKKLKKQYKDAMDGNVSAATEITFIDGKLKELGQKRSAVASNLEERSAEFGRMMAKLAECEQVERSLLGDVKTRVLANNHILSRNQKAKAREVKQEASGFSNQNGTTCTAGEAAFRKRRLREIAAERDALVAKLRASGAMGATLADMKKLSMNGGPGAGILNGSDSMKSLPNMKYTGGAGLKGSASTGVL